MSKLGPDNTPRSLAAAGWQVEASPPNVGSEHPSTVRLVVNPTGAGRSRLTAAGVAAVLAQFSTYLSSSKAASVATRAGAVATPGCAVSAGGGYIDVLPEDGPAQITALVGILATAGNVT